MLFSLAQAVVVFSILYILLRLGTLALEIRKSRYFLKKQREREIERFISRLEKERAK